MRPGPTTGVAGGHEDWSEGTQPAYPTDAIVAPHQVSQPDRHPCPVCTVARWSQVVKLRGLGVALSVPALHVLSSKGGFRIGATESQTTWIQRHILHRRGIHHHDWSASFVLRNYPITSTRAPADIRDASHPAPIRRAPRGARRFDGGLAVSQTARRPLEGPARLGLRAVRRRLEHGQAEIPDRFVQTAREDAVPVVNQVPVGRIESDDLPHLPQGPCGAPVCRHGDAHESRGEDPLAMLQQQFVGDALFAPEWILARHAPDRLARVQRNRRSSRS